MSQTKLILSAVVALTLFIGGLVLFFLRISFWSLFLGIPSIQIGIIFLIYVFDKVSTSAIDQEDKEDQQVQIALQQKKKG